MKAAVLHVNSAGAESTSPTMRIARFAAETLGVPLIHNPETARRYQKTKFDVLFVKYGMLKFSNHRDEALEIHENAKCRVNLENDYTFVPDKRFSKAEETWSTVEKRTRYVNWNVLTRRPLQYWQQHVPFTDVTEQGLLYYGAHRPGRVPYFNKYLRKAPYPVTISTFRGRKAFIETCGDQIEVIGAFRKPEDAARWPMTVYIEDEQSHSLYCSPANRFYECVQMGLAQAVDESALRTLRHGGVKQAERWLVRDRTDLRDMLCVYDSIRKKQRELWYRDYGIDILEQLGLACKLSFGHNAFKVMERSYV
jgi:hypothetical protein